MAEPQIMVTGQNVQYDASGMHVVRQRLRACRFNGFQSIGQDGSEDIDHLPVAAGLAFQFALNVANWRW